MCEILLFFFEREKVRKNIFVIICLALGETLQSRQFPCLKAHCHSLASPHSIARHLRNRARGSSSTDIHTEPFESLITMTHHSMPETAGTAIRIDLTSVEFLHFTHMLYLSYVKYNLIPHTHRTYSPQPPRNNQGPKLAHS